MARRPAKKWMGGPADELAVKEGCWFDLAAAKRVRLFFRKFLRHSKGEWAGQSFELLDWQWDDVVAPLFGWIRRDGTRRYRLAYIEVAKKNGKSTLCAGLSLYLLIADDEAGAEVYSAAADREQASIIYQEAARMVLGSPALAAHIMVTNSRKTLGFPRMNSLYKALSADVPTKEGLNIHGLVFDELHAQRTRRLWDTLTYGGAARRQPLMIAITTAGWDRNSICWEQHDYAKQVLDGRIPDWSFFAYIAAAGENDDWTKPRTWAKANPSLGVTVRREELSEACKEATASPTKENTFKRYRLNIWTEQDVRWLQMAKWDACGTPVDPASVIGLPCYAGLDLSSNTDITAFVLAFERPTGGYALLPRFWIPEDNAQRREDRDRVPYLTWARQGLIEMTPGNVIDYDRVKAGVCDWCQRYSVREVAVDRWNAEHMMQLLGAEGLEIVPFGQGFFSMSAPTKQFEKLVLGAQLAHGGHPVLRWMAGNVTVDTGEAENLKPSKAKSTERIDGIVAGIMAIGRAMVSDKHRKSVYDERGLLTL